MKTITEFIKERKLSLSKKEEQAFRTACSYIAKQGADIRIEEDKSFYYDEGALCSIYNEIVLNNQPKVRVFKKLFSQKAKEESSAQEDLFELMPEGVMSVGSFVEKHKEYKAYQDNIGRIMSSLFSCGSVKRYNINGHKNRVAYNEADLLKYSKEYIKKKNTNQLKNRQKKKATVVPAETKQEVYIPGIFVRMWRWLFGYRKEEAK